MDTKPFWKHQAEAIHRAEHTRDFGLFFEQGTGKTRTTIEILRRKYAKAGRILRTLILCPPVVCSNWRNEFIQFSNIKRENIHVLAGTHYQRMQTVRTKGFTPLATVGQIFITNYEGMLMSDLIEVLHEWKIEVLVCDESQRCKSPSSKRAKAVAKISQGTAHNYILTGTPVVDGKGLDFFQQFLILDRGNTFGQNFFAFRAKYFRDKNAGMPKGRHFAKWIPAPSMQQEFIQRMGKVSMRVEKKDCLDLPPLLKVVHEVEMGAEQQKAYDAMMRDCIAFVENKKGENANVVANLAIVKTMRLQQIVSGFVKDEDGNVIRFKDVPRLTALKGLLEDTVVEEGHKAIVWCNFVENYRMVEEVCEELGIEHAHIVGGMSAAQREESIERFRKGSASVMISHPAAGGVGVNFTEAAYSFYYSKGYKLEDDLQSEARNYRGGSEIHEKVTRVDLVSLKTIDELIDKSLRNKQQVATGILTWLGSQ